MHMVGGAMTSMARQAIEEARRDLSAARDVIRRIDRDSPVKDDMRTMKAELRTLDLLVVTALSRLAYVDDLVFAKERFGKIPG